ncbi:uncharacterized protein LOC125863764 [Solanum stenotomum]|uniref:uncharacterized protein LOC125863764 n=1 Tax=Solanum stenotomum TaxID=172797 RepID=UPI0020D14E50|nr:uncharacterized protein LOC125863764 [Solanum stenotomum]
MTNESITKREDPGAFTITCTIGMLQFTKALCDLGAIINLMPYAIYKQLGLGEPKATTMRLLMADQSIKHPVGILYDTLVKIDRFIFLTDFVILDCEIDAEIPIILGRPFLATGRALLDIDSRKLKFHVNDNEVTFNICKCMKQSSNIHVVSTKDVIDEAVATVSHLMRKNEPLESVLANYDEFEVQVFEEVVAALLGLGVYLRNLIKLDIYLKNRESPPAKPSIEEPPNLELKALPSHLKYASLGDNNTLPVIIATDLLERHVKLLIEVLRKHIKAIRWTIADIVGIPHGICTHKIRLDSEYSKWVSLLQCVPKKRGITVVPNAKGELVPTRPVTGWKLYMDYQKLNSWTEKDHFPMPFMDQMLDRLSERGWYCLLDGYSGYNQISIAPEDQEKPLSLALMEHLHSKECHTDYCPAKFTVTEQELLAVVYAFENFRAYLLGTKVIVHIDHSALRYLMAKKDVKPRLIRWVLLLQEFDFEVKDQKGYEN